MDVDMVTDMVANLDMDKVVNNEVDKMINKVTKDIKVNKMEDEVTRNKPCRVVTKRVEMFQNEVNQT